MTWAAEILQKTPIWGFCVAYGSEALELAGRIGRTKPILVVSAWEPNELDRLIREGIRLVAWDHDAIGRIARTSRRLGVRTRVHLKIDTGTSRIGVRTDSAAEFIRTAARLPSINIEGIFSHFADSEGESLAFAREQLRRFDSVAASISAPLKHMACTAATIRLPLNGTNLVRLGIGLYGLWPSAATHRVARFDLKPVMSWKTHILQVKRVPAGTTVGYGRTYRVRRKMPIAILPIGYSDGFDRRASNTGWVMVHGRRCPVIGRISMNLTAVDVSRAPSARPGDDVTLIGPGIDAERLAESWGTLHYEVISRIHPLIPRIPVA